MLQQTQPLHRESEEGLIATSLSAEKLWHEIAYVKPEDFSDQYLGNIWKAISSLRIEGKPANPRSVAFRLTADPEQQQQAVSFLSDIVANLLTSLQGPEYARVVRDLADRRRILALCDKVSVMARDTTTDRTANEITGQVIAELTGTLASQSQLLNAYEVGKEVVDELSIPVNVYPTGLPKFDQACGGGFYQNKLYGIGARMKSGKSLMLSTIAYNMTILGDSRVLYLCLEMGSKETMQRLLARKMGINALQFIDPKNRNNPQFINKAKAENEYFKSRGLHFVSHPRMDLDDLKGTIARAGMSGKIDGIIVDYLQLVTGKQKSQSTAEHYDHVAQCMAESVKRYNIWVLTAAQLNQEGNIRGGEGLLNACDITFAMSKIEAYPCDAAYLEMKASRYTPYMDIGSEASPGYDIRTDIGPMFEERL